MYPGRVDNVRDATIGAVILAEILDKQQQHFTSYDLVPMHVRDILKLWFA